MWQLGGKTPLHLAAQEGQAAIVAALLAAGADKDAKDEVRWRGCRVSRGRFGVVWAPGRLVVLMCVRATKNRCRYAVTCPIEDILQLVYVPLHRVT